MYTCVVEMLAWPSSSCTTRRSAPWSSMCVAQECRSTCGDRWPSSPTRSPALRTIVQHAWRLMRPPRAFRNTASLSAHAPRAGRCAARAGRRARYEPTTRRALRPIGTIRSLSPLPSTRTTPSSRSRSLELEPDRLADADAGARTAVSSSARSRCGERLVAGDRAEQLLDLVLVERLRDPGGTRRRVDLLARVGRRAALGRAEPVERAHRHERPRDRRRREQPAGRRRRCSVAEMAHVGLHASLADRGRVGLAAVAQERGVAAEVAAVRGARVRRRGRARPRASRRARRAAAPARRTEPRPVRHRGAPSCSPRQRRHLTSRARVRSRDRQAGQATVGPLAARPRRTRRTTGADGSAGS